MSNIDLEYDVQTTYDEKSINFIIEQILYFQFSLEINDLDIGTLDYVKIKDKGKIISSLLFEPEYIKKLAPKYIKSEKGTKEYKDEYEELIKEIKKLKNIQTNILSKKINKNLIDGLITFLLTDSQKEKMINEYGLDFSIGKRYSNFRINLSFQDLDNGEVGAYFSIRKINKTPFTLEEMNITKTIKNKFSVGSGLILISGPTGSAKTSTLISIMDWFNKTKHKKIITIEDPIEFYWSGLQNKCTFRQREIGKSCLSFPHGLKQAVRQNPDIIIVGEIRDAETASLAIEAANTGHLVIATIHVNSTTKVLDRLLGFFDGTKSKEIATKLSGVLKFILNQRLITTVKKEYKVAYEWLDPTIGGIKLLIKEANLEDMRSKMYEMDENGKSYHKTLNESLFERIITGELTSIKAKEHYSNEVDIFDKEFRIFKKRYIKHNGLSEKEVEKKIFIAEEIEKLNNKTK